VKTQKVLFMHTNQNQSKLPAEDIVFLKKITADVIEASRVGPGQDVASYGPNMTGDTIIRPGGRNCYPAFWVRDYAMSLETGFMTSRRLSARPWPSHMRTGRLLIVEISAMFANVMIIVKPHYGNLWLAHIRKTLIRTGHIGIPRPAGLPML